ncbi:MAG: nucleotide exchange factor GrpE, partial [Candidatus Eiseniibacteriota bacterium]
AAWITRVCSRWSMRWAIASPTCCKREARVGADVTERRPEDPGAEGRDPQDVSDAPERVSGEAPLENEAAAGAASIEAASPEDAAQMVDYHDRWLRTEADFQNYRRRAQRDLEETRRNAEESVMHEIIAAIDDLDRALGAATAANAPESWTSGVRLVANRLLEYLARQGVTVVEPVGQPFDPAYHEALLEVDAPEGVAPGAVVQVVLKGYRRGNRVLRAARVVVAKRERAGGA